MKAKTRKEYIAAWNGHISELIHPFLDADRPIDDWMEMRGELRKVVGEAAEKSFAEKEITCGACTVGIGAHTKDENCEHGEAR